MEAWQTCPQCYGTGIDQHLQGITSSIEPSATACMGCPVCKGRRIIGTLTGQPPGNYVQLGKPEKLKPIDYEQETE